MYEKWKYLFYTFCSCLFIYQNYLAEVPDLLKNKRDYIGFLRADTLI